jgi:alpha-glucuronidase
MRFSLRSVVGVLAFCAATATLHGQEPAGRPAWLQYAIPPDPPRYHDMPRIVVQLGDAPEENAASDELDRGLGHMVAGTDHLLRRFEPRVDLIVLGTTDALRRVRPRILLDPSDAALPEDGYRIRHVRNGPRQWWVLEGGSPRAELYAAFRFAALVAEDRQLPDRLVETAKLPMRAIDLRGDLKALPGGLPVLGRLMASVGLNGLIVDAGFVSSQELVAVMKPFGIRVWIRGVDAESVAGTPGIGGVVVADAQQAEIAMHALRRHGASVMLDVADGAKSAVVHGTEPNLLLVHSAALPTLPLAGLASPDFGTMAAVPQVASVSLFPAHERAVVYPAAVWESLLETPERGVKEDSTLADVLAHRNEAAHGGVVATLTVADAVEMLRQPLMQANLFAFGKVAWNPAAAVDEVADDWARQTFGDDARVFGVAKDVLLASTAAFLNVSSPFGLPALGEDGRPDPARAAKRDATLPLADAKGIGVDRVSELSHYPAAFAAELADPATCPEKWLLAVHRVAPTWRLANTKTIVQAFYDAHFAGSSQMSNALDAWESTKDLVDGERYAAIHDLLSDAARHGEIWRDVTTEWMERATGVADEPHFVGSHPGRVEAEKMVLKGFIPAPAAEPEDGSGGAYAACSLGQCTAEMLFRGEANVYRIETGYYGSATGGWLELRVNGVPQGRWPVEQEPGRPGSAVAERFVVNGVRLKPDDRVAVVGQTALDFIEVTRDPRWN